MRKLSRLKNLLFILMFLNTLASPVIAQECTEEEMQFDPFACGENPDEEVPIDSGVLFLVGASVLMVVYRYQKKTRLDFMVKSKAG